MSSGASAASSCWAASSFRVLGWKTGKLCSKATTFTGGGVSFMPRFLGLSGWV